MGIKNFSNQSQTIVGAAVVLGLMSLVSRLIGILRDRVFANQFGAGDILDAYYAAFRIPDFIYNLIIVGALSAGFIPVFLHLINKDRRKAWRVTNSVINILGILLLIICGLFFIFTPQLTRWLAPGFDAEKIKLTISLTRIMFLSPILLGLSGIASSVLQSFKNFFIYSLTPIMYNIGIIIGAMFFVPIWGINGLAYGVILGAFLHLILQLPTLWQHGFRYQPLILWRDKHVREIGKLMIPRTLGIAINQLNFLAITIIGSTLISGSIAIFNLANNLQYFPIGIIGVSFAIAAFPTLSQAVAENRRHDVITELSATIRQILFFIIPITIIFLLLRAQIVRVVLGSGQFNWNDTILTANTLAFFSFSLFAQCLIPLLARAFYALHDTWTPFLIGLATTVANITTAIYFKSSLGVSGLALAFSISTIIQLVLIWLFLRKKLGTLKENEIITSLYKISVAALIMAIVVQLFKAPLSGIVNMEKFWGIFTQGAIAGTVGLLVYCGILFLLKSQEILQFNASLKKRWLRLWSVEGEVNKE
ncbi:MAG: murein biosynthesis integral membrane protein MurJ [Candidatus Magasanikbacteria bacterium RIFCSPLOWO2_01_FULL_43_20b]|uniref:Probable lipid II flippase MurJ n=1 Tax=Candidatus Magasanikbacteria bacterium RIFCSPLOWO2_12_FULL_43_12 TaxID=1798692 RepID=A0A1F6MQL7_9BACT|nr:MAG: murein biosynthesis integral membrane protein MurJ [Candidatus Magasanikbacteria bacterium RIFCSPLOWO2_02_FULL_43_22]OGH73660.1 MAG: murein biosynthesis integral membrane protein MurJ [Candidatus Magasanikbacteria bacterium RIFCSPLOWO2_01_FULL_43_20b]OGH73959.1 MAG: murein biosynthesis integral membrane protein MurJ [Candidatus Magasanikbacteria bacterium RIFCSPLOWO2_12_FULL_43_12]